MSDAAPPSDAAAGDDDPNVVIVIVRTGGVAGIRRQWQVAPPPDKAPRWVALIEQCPWDAPNPQQSGADRYIWSIRARTSSDLRERDVPDGALAGPWRDLVDAVRDAAHAASQD